MVDVPEHLAPRDGLTNATIRFAGLDADGSSARVRFEMLDHNKYVIGELVVPVGPVGSVDQMISIAHQGAINILRQWIHVLEIGRKGYDTGSDGQ